MVNTYLLSSCSLAVKPQGGHELAQALFHIQAELPHMPIPQPCMHDFMRNNAPGQQPREPALHQDGSDLHEATAGQLLSRHIWVVAVTLRKVHLGLSRLLVGSIASRVNLISAPRPEQVSKQGTPAGACWLFWAMHVNVATLDPHVFAGFYL